MQNKNQVNAEIDLVTTLKVLAHAYEEISVIRMQKSRAAVLANRAFLTKLSEVFHDVKESYRKQILDLMDANNKGKKTFTFSTQKKNGKKALVFIASNARLYGDIVKKVFNMFMNDVKSHPDADIVIVGKVGKELFDDQQSVRKPYHFFEIPDVGVQFDDLKPVVSYLFPYDEATVYYGQFRNLMNQDANITSISGDQPLPNADPEDKKFTYFFEPSLEKIMEFFENNVFASLLKQTVHEGELSRLASRAKSMESAIANIEKSEKELIGESRKMRKTIENKKRMESIAGMALWK